MSNAPALTPDDAKTFATLRARAARAGVTVHACLDDKGRREFVAARWTHAKGFTSLAELKTWLDLIGAPR